MAPSRRQHDQPNPNLIVEGSRKVQPSKRVQGQDYPTTVLEELDQRNKGRSYFICATAASIHFIFTGIHSIPMTLNYTPNRNVSELSSGIGSASGTYFKDTSKPDGDACREDGTLKDASEMDWADSPSEPHFGEYPDLDGNARHEDSDLELSYLSVRKKRKQDFSDDDDSDIIMTYSDDKSTQRMRLRNNSSDDHGSEPRNTAAGSSSTAQRQFHRKNEKRKKKPPDCESDADSGESEKEDIVMDDTKEVTSKVSLFSYLCNACAR